MYCYWNGYCLGKLIQQVEYKFREFTFTLLLFSSPTKLCVKLQSRQDSLTFVNNQSKRRKTLNCKTQRRQCETTSLFSPIIDDNSLIIKKRKCVGLEIVKKKTPIKRLDVDQRIHLADHFSGEVSSAPHLQTRLSLANINYPGVIISNLAQKNNLEDSIQHIRRCVYIDGHMNWFIFVKKFPSKLFDRKSNEKMMF